MTTHTSWFVQQAEVDEDSDPFAMPIQEIGQRFDLRDPAAALQLRLTELIGRESNLDAKQVTCPIKNRPDTTCHACPVSQAHNTELPLAVLCRLGREQEVVLTELAVLACHDR